MDKVAAYTYNSAGQLASVTNGFGRTLTLAYSGAGQLTTVRRWMRASSPTPTMAPVAWFRSCTPIGKGRNFRL